MEKYSDVIYKTNPDYSAHTISGTTVVIPVSENCPKFNGMIKLLGIGVFLWDIFSEGATLNKACSAVVEKYDVSFEQAKKDIEEFIQMLLENELIQTI